MSGKPIGDRGPTDFSIHIEEKCASPILTIGARRKLRAFSPHKCDVCDRTLLTISSLAFRANTSNTARPS